LFASDGISFETKSENTLQIEGKGCKRMEGFHSSVIKKYFPKIKKGDVLIGCDFRSFRYDFYALGFKESDFKPCQFKNQSLHRLEYLYIN
jgi:hypothetical protein